MNNKGTRQGLVLVKLLVVIAFVFGAEAQAFLVEDSIKNEVSLVGVASISGEALDLSGLQQTLIPEKGIAEDEIKPGAKFTNNMLGGISAIAWTGKEDLYWCLPDRGPLSGAVNWKCRIHQIRITTGPENGVSTELVSTILLKDKRGTAFTGLASAFEATEEQTQRLDPEGVRVGSNGNLFISDEYGPRLIEFLPNGQMVREFEMPSHFTPEKCGVCHATENTHNVSGRSCNRGMEGLAISADHKHLFGLIQSPLLQDSFREKPTDYPSGVSCRLPVFETSGAFCTEYLYPLEHPSNVLNEILAYGDNRFITIERDGKAGVEAQCKKLMLISISDATNIRGVEKLPPNQLPEATKGVKKTVFIDLLDPKWNLAGQKMPEKIEGLAFGPDFPNGDKLLVVASDNDFVPESPTEIFVFRIPNNRPAENRISRKTFTRSR